MDEHTVIYVVIQIYKVSSRKFSYEYELIIILALSLISYFIHIHSYIRLCFIPMN